MLLSADSGNLDRHCCLPPNGVLFFMVTIQVPKTAKLLKRSLDVLFCASERRRKNNDGVGWDETVTDWSGDLSHYG